MVIVPDSLPVLRRGRHRNPRRGACFMEYTSVLAGEPWSDAPGCTDPQLAAVLRHANDRLSDADRPRLVPLLGQAIGLVVPGGLDRSRRTRLANRLHAEVSARFAAALEFVPDRYERRLLSDGRSVDGLFWWL